LEIRMTGFWMDIRTAFRTMGHRPLFTLTCVATLALGFGSVTSVFTVTDSVVLRALPYPESDRLVRLDSGTESDGVRNASGANYLDWKAQATSFEALAGLCSRDFNFAGAEYPIRVLGVSVTPEFFAVLGSEPARGRVLSPDVDGPGGEPVVVVGDGFWRTHLGADPDAVGSVVKLNGQPHTVVGVMPPGFSYPGKTALWKSSAFRVPDPPVDVGEDPAENRGADYFQVVGRLRQGVSLADAQAEMSAIAVRLAKEYPDPNEGVGIVVQSLRDSIIGDARPRLMLLLAAAGLVLLISCVNVAGMLLARGTERLGEIGVRLAIGAERRRIVRLFLIESLMLAFIGGTAGVALAAWATKVLLGVAPDSVPRTGEVTVDTGVLLFAVAVVFGASLLFGLAPAIHALRLNRPPIVNEGRGGQAFGRSGRLRRGLVVAEVAASLLLIIGTLLVIRTFMILNAVDPGFETRGLLVGHVALPGSAYQENDSIRDFHDRVLEKLRAVPGVESASTVLTFPMHRQILGYLGFTIEGRPEESADPPVAGYQVVEPDYFATMNIPLLRGRVFNGGDVDGRLRVALVNQTTADRYWPGEDPIGQRVSWGFDDNEDRIWATIVGIVGDVHVEGLDIPPRPETYLPFAQEPFTYMTLILRTGDDPASFAPALRRAVNEVDPNQPVNRIKTMDAILATELAQRRFNMVLMGTFAGVAVLLVAVGLYGMLSFNISRRRHEIGIRRALGALPRDIASQFIRDGLRMIALGLALGLAATLVAARFLSTQLHGIRATDPLTYVFAALVLTGVGLLACYLPARRAARVEPMAVLRTE
jgi:putative ABC transport system permease protein